MFKTRVHGKWILAGEHSVLRGHPAIVFPVTSCFLDVEFESGGTEVLIECESEQSEQLKMVVLGLLEKALTDLGKARSALAGQLRITNKIPLAGGMGASAALCVVVVRLLHHAGFVEEQEIYSRAKSLEDLFHGQSSGVDISVALTAKPLLFKIPGEFIDFKPVWKPHWYVSHCGRRGVTAECVKAVKDIWAKDEGLAQRIDQDMLKSVELAKASLLREEGFSDLQQAILLAKSCFERWGLISDDMQKHMSWLHQEGALVTKPTGSGQGGFVLSVWPEARPDLSELIPV